MVFRLKVVNTGKIDRQELYDKIIQEYPEIDPDITNIGIKDSHLVIKVIDFLESYPHNKRIEIEITDNIGVIYHIKNDNDYMAVKRIFIDLWTKEIQNSKTIFDNTLSNKDKRLLLKRVNKDSKLYKSYSNYLYRIAIDFEKKITNKTVTLDQIVHQYNLKSDVQSGIPDDAYPTNSVDLRLFPLEMSDLQKITDLINEIKEK